MRDIGSWSENLHISVLQSYISLLQIGVQRYIKKPPGQRSLFEHNRNTQVIGYRNRIVSCELIWIKQFLQELKFENIQQMKLSCEIQAAICIMKRFFLKKLSLELFVQIINVRKYLRSPLGNLKDNIYFPS